MSDQIADAAGRLTDAGLSILIARISASEDIPEELRGEVIGMLHTQRPALVGLSVDVLQAAIVAIKRGEMQAAETLMLAAAKAEALIAQRLDRAEARTARARIRNRGSAILTAIMAALERLVTTVGIDMLEEWLSGD